MLCWHTHLVDRRTVLPSSSFESDTAAKQDQAFRHFVAAALRPRPLPCRPPLTVRYTVPGAALLMGPSLSTSELCLAGLRSASMRMNTTSASSTSAAGTTSGVGMSSGILSCTVNNKASKKCLPTNCQKGVKSGVCMPETQAVGIAAVSGQWGYLCVQGRLQSRPREGNENEL